MQSDSRQLLHGLCFPWFQRSSLPLSRKAYWFPDTYLGIVLWKQWKEVFGVFLSLGSSGCRQQVPPASRVCSWGEQTARALPHTEQTGRHHPQDISGKVLLPSLTSNKKKRQGSGQCVSFSICQSLKVHSIYIACFFIISLYRLACRAFKKQNKHFFHFVFGCTQGALTLLPSM